MLKKLNNFLRTGQKGGGASNSNTTTNDDGDDATAETMEHIDCDIKMDGGEQQRAEGDESSALTETKMITSNQPKVAIDIDNVLKVIENADKCSSSSSSTGNTEAGNAIQCEKASCENSDTMASNSISKNSNNESHKRGAVAGPDPTKPLQPKAKVLRQQRKAEKLLSKANSMNTPTTNENNVSDVDAAKKNSKNTEKTFKSFIHEMPADGKHKLKVCYKSK